MEKKQRYSKQREMIYEFLRSTHDHPSAETVYEHLKSEIPNLSLGTVYRNLKVLEEMGKIRRVSTLQNVERYDAWCLDHAHFVCENCGCVKDLAALDVKNFSQHYHTDGKDQIQWMNMIFGGQCADCVANA